MAQNLVDFEDIYEAVEAEVANGSATDRSTIKNFINRIYRKCVSKIVELNRDFYLTVVSKNTVVDQYQYDFNTDWSLTDVLKPIALLDENDAPIIKGSNRWDIEEFTWVGNRGLRFVTAPDSVTTYKLQYIARQADLSAISDTPKIEQIHYDILFWGACYLYFLWKKDKDMASFYKSFFNEAFEEFVAFHDTDLSNQDRILTESDGLE